MLHKVIRVVEVEHALVVGLGDMLGEQDAPGQVPAHLAGDVVPLGGGDGGVLVGVLLRQLLVVVADEGQDGLVGGVGLAHQRPGVAVDNIGLGQLVLSGSHQLGLHHVLDVLHQQAIAAAGFGHGIGDGLNGSLVDAAGLVHRSIGLLDGGDDFCSVKLHNGVVSFDDFHGAGSLLMMVLLCAGPVEAVRSALEVSGAN